MVIWYSVLITMVFTLPLCKSIIFSSFIERVLQMTFDELIQARRSVRQYLPDKVLDQSVIKEILRAAQLAPSWKNSQTGRYYVVRSLEMLEKARACLPTFNQNSSKNACALIVTSFVRGVAGFSGGEAENELGDGWGAYDLGLQNAYLTLKASDLGLDTLIMGIRDSKALRSLLDIPCTEEIGAVLALGFRDGNSSFRPRKTLDEIARFF